MRTGLLLLMLACHESEQERRIENSPELSPCERALSHLVDWSDIPEPDSQRQSTLIVACEDGRSMATADRLDCLIQKTPEAAARCTITDERRPLIDACAEDGGEALASECALTLAEPGAVLLENRIRPLVDGSWLDLWSCHAPEDGELAPEEGLLLICGLQILREISLKDCALGQIRAQHCVSRWRLQVPRVERWLTSQLQPQAG